MFRKIVLVFKAATKYCIFVILIGLLIILEANAKVGEEGPDKITLQQTEFYKVDMPESESYQDNWRDVDNFLCGFQQGNFSPDGKKYAFYTLQKITFFEEGIDAYISFLKAKTNIYDFTTEKLETLTEVCQGRYNEAIGPIQWSPDGTKILFTAYRSTTNYQSGESIYWMSTAGGGSAVEVTTITGTTGTNYCYPDWLSETKICANKGLKDIVTMNLDGSNEQVIYSTTTDHLGRISPLPDRSKIYFAVKNYSGYDYAAWPGDGEVLTRRLGIINPDGTGLLWLTPPDRLVLGQSENCSPFPTDGLYEISYLEWDEEGEVKSYEESGRWPPYKVVVVNQDGTKRIEASNCGYCPFISVDGTKVFYGRLSDDYTMEYLCSNVDGTGEPIPVEWEARPGEIEGTASADPTKELEGSVWSPDGQFFVFTRAHYSYSSDREESVSCYIAQLLNETTIPEEGGVAKDTAYSEVDVPDGALEEETNVGVTSPSPEEIVEMTGVEQYLSPAQAKALNISPAQPLAGNIDSRVRRTFKIKKPPKKLSKYTVHYLDEELLSQGIPDETKLRAYYWTGSVWERVGGTVDAANNTVSFYSNHSGTYGLFYEPDPSKYQIKTDFGKVKIQPNPFSPNNDGVDDVCRIKFNTDTDTEVTVKVYNIAGELIATLCEEESRPAEQDWESGWDGINWKGEKVGSGIYLCHIKAGNKEKVVKIAVVR